MKQFNDKEVCRLYANKEHDKLTDLDKEIIKILSNDNQKLNILDYGCGFGRFYNQLTNRHKLDNNFKYLGFDISKDILDLAKSMYPSGNFSNTINFSNVDFLLCLDVVNFVDNKIEFLNNLVLIEAKNIILIVNNNEKENIANGVFLERTKFTDDDFIDSNLYKNYSLVYSKEFNKEKLYHFVKLEKKEQKSLKKKEFELPKQEIKKEKLIIKKKVKRSK